MNFLETGDVRQFPKGSILLRRGEVCRFGCKVIAGCLKSYVIDEAGKEHIMQFAPEGWIITDMHSLFTEAPSHIYIEAIEDSTVHWLNGETAHVWAEASRADLIEQIQLLTRHIITANKRTRMLLSSTSQERYLDFVETYPALAQRLPLKQIAAYLGMTPEYLSEVRRKIAQQRTS